ncbi:hypothetical protein WICMUC_000683 [Wickerhamomyces mucosus]|uniref:Uncharacterized protein n=1 Tax=Wickerhamomyces mucosus TaxID=1378264 RepID=A0A9P8TIJ6_9ASCO|nr:hypothetical protein WICMUC_000683 [Wickerhamomyces mucosus]
MPKYTNTPDLSDAPPPYEPLVNIRQDYQPIESSSSSNYTNNYLQHQQSNGNSSKLNSYNNNANSHINTLNQFFNQPPTSHSYTRPPVSFQNNNNNTNNNNNNMDDYLNSTRLPWDYPRGYFCDKCHNTGYKLKNGKSCKKCWEKFARQTNVQYIPSPYPTGSNYNYSGYQIPFTNYSINHGNGPSYNQPIPLNHNQLYQPIPPRIVRPGDPSLGGVLCGKCRGSGTMFSFLALDNELW